MKYLYFIFILVVSVNSNSLSLSKEYPESLSDSLAGLRTAIKIFHKDTGRLPTNEEGFNVLFAFEHNLKVPDYRKGGYLPLKTSSKWLEEYGYFKVNTNEIQNYYIWRKDSEKRLGYVVGSWFVSPNKSLQSTAKAAVECDVRAQI